MESFLRAVGALLMLLANAAFTQPLSFGLKAGVPLTSLVQADPAAAASATTNRYTVGGDIELHFPRNLSLEFDVLYRHLHYSDSLSFPLPGGEIFERVSTSTWEFPVLLKYRLPGEAVRPYITVGPAFDAVALRNRFAEFAVNPPSVQTTTGTNSSSLALQNSLAGGLTAGAGVELSAGRIHCSPEIRFTHWFSPNFSAPYLLNGKQDQIEFLLGFSF